MMNVSRTNNFLKIYVKLKQNGENYVLGLVLYMFVLFLSYCLYSSIQLFFKLLDTIQTPTNSSLTPTNSSLTPSNSSHVALENLYLYPSYPNYQPQPGLNINEIPFFKNPYPLISTFWPCPFFWLFFLFRNIIPCLPYLFHFFFTFIPTGAILILMFICSRPRRPVT